MYQVMIIDDEPKTVDKLSDFVHQSDSSFHVVAKAFGAEDALFYMATVTPDLIITDIKMPEIDGLTLLSQLRQMNWNGHAAIITGYDEFAYAQQAIRLDVFEYILKPVFPEDISALLTRTKEILNREQKNIAKLRNEIERELHFSGTDFETEKHLPVYIEQAKAIIRERFAESLSLSEVAKLVSVHPVYLSSLFAKHCGQNFLEFLTEFRITKAKELLIHTNLQVQEVALKVGYTDVTYFNRVFRRKTNQTPGNFRAQYRN